MPYLVQIVLASLRVEDRWLIPVVAKMASCHKTVSSYTTAKPSASMDQIVETMVDASHHYSPVRKPQGCDARVKGDVPGKL
jgi:hypothetical protein